ncbi:ABC transporter permease [Halorussus salinus]|uniref:ABC transporter permease n=1 Tax=Halorussus salinus TaxID=1364935 RepID=UPI0010918A16|nr:ABC transporter permease [Halorussus salinus]
MTEETSADRTGGHRHLWRAVLKREVVLFVRYPLNALGGFVVFLFMFLVIFLGGRAFAAPALSSSIEGIVVGFFLWTLATASYVDISQDIGKDAKWGTLERHLMTPFGFGVVLASKSVAKLLREAVMAVALLVVMLLLTGVELRLDVLTVVPILVATLASVFGLGFAMGGLTLLYKQIGNWAALLQFGFIALVAAPTLDLGWARLLPLAQGSALLQRAMTDGTRLWEFPATDLGILLATGIGYLLAGYLVFQFAQRRARRLGVLGHY